MAPPIGTNMPDRFRSATLRTLFAFLVLTVCAGAADPPEIRVGSELDFRPYCFTDKNGQPTGFGVELLRAVAEKATLRLRISPGEWDKVWNQLLAGEIDVLPVVAQTPGRKELVEFTVPHTETFDAFFVRAGRAPIKNLAAAAGKEIVVLRSDAAHHQLVERRFSGKVVPVDSITEGLRLIAAGKYDALLCSRLIGVLERDQAGIKGVIDGPVIPDYERVFSFAVRKGDTELAERLNQGLRLVQADGTYGRLYQKWLGVRTAPLPVWQTHFWQAIGFVGVLMLIAVTWIVARKTLQLDSRMFPASTPSQSRMSGVIWRYAMAPLVAAAAFVVQTGLSAWVGASLPPFVLFYMAVMVAALIAGLGPGLLTTVLSAIVMHIWVMEPAGQWFAASPADRLALILFLFSGLLICMVAHLYRRTRSKAAAYEREAALRENERRFRQVAESLPQLIWTCAVGGPCDYLSPQWLQYTGKSEAEQLGYGWLEQLHPDDRVQTLDKWQDAAARGENFEMESRIRRHDGAYRWFRTLAVPLHDETGNVVKWLGSSTDIDNIKQAEEALRRKQAELQLLFDNAPAGLVLFDARQRYTVLAHNRYYQELFAEPFRSSGMIGMSVHDYAPELEASGIVAVLDEVVRTAQPRSFLDFPYESNPPRQSWFNWHVLPLIMDNQVVALVSMSVDVTDRHLAEEALRTSEEKHRSELERRVAEQTAEIQSGYDALRAERQRLFDVLETLPVMICLLTQDYHVSFANRSFRDKFGESGGRHCYEYCFGFTEPCGFCESFNALKTGRLHHWEVTANDGSVIDVYDLPFTDADNSPMILEMDIDITHRRQAERELRKAHEELEGRAAQLRALAAELTLTEQRERNRLALVLHDGLQQMLVAAKFQLALAERQKNVSQAIADISNLMDDCIETSRSLTAELSPPILHRGGLIPALEWLVQWMRDKHGLAVELTSQGQPGTAPEEIYILLFQSARELLFNVIKHAGTRKAQIAVAHVDGSIRVEVSDQGTGFDPEKLVNHVSREGSGMGLFSIRERLGYLGGIMEIDAALGRGAKFTLIAPIISASGGKAESGGESRTSIAFTTRPAPDRADAEKICVVLVDDHPVMRQGLASLLSVEPDILIVGEASDGRSAIDLVHSTRSAVVLMDISMPGMDGVETTRKIHERMPDVKIIGLSMFQEGEQAAAILAAGAVDYLAKTGPSEAVIKAIRKCARMAEKRSAE